MSAQDWNNVDLTLVSGNPVTFRQSLYSAYYVNRPEVPIAVTGRLLPRADQGDVGGGTNTQAPKSPGKTFGQRRLRKESFAARSRGVAVAADMLRQRPTVSLSMAPPARLNATAQDAATQIAFHLPRRISVKSGHSLSVWFLNRDVAAERVSLYQPDTHSRHPFAAIKIKNDGKSGLPPGALTFYEVGTNGALTFVGDAQLKTLPVGEERILSYALDNKTTIDRETSNSQSILKGKIS